MNAIASTKVFHIKVIADQMAAKTHKNRPPQSLEYSVSADRFNGAGRVGTFSGSESNTPNCPRIVEQLDWAVEYIKDL